MEVIDEQDAGENEKSNSIKGESESDGGGSETGVARRVKQHRLNLNKQR